MRNSDRELSNPSSPARLRQRFRVPFHHADAGGSAGIISLAGYLQQIAGEHAEALGVGAERLAEDGLFWVLTRLFLRIERAPFGGETVEFETWPSQRPRQLFQRDFRLFVAEGMEIIAATSHWALIDAGRRKAVKGPAWIADRVAVDPDRATAFPDPAPMRLDRIERSVEVKPRWSDIDVNGHVNNANLVGWLFEAFESQWLAAHAAAALNIAFRAECRRDDEVRCCATRLAGESLAQTLLRGDGAEIVRARSWWRGAD